jgi:hypothetical protein
LLLLQWLYSFESWSLPSLPGFLISSLDRSRFQLPSAASRDVRIPKQLSHLSANYFIVQEGLFLYTRDASPYQGGLFHQVRTFPLLTATRPLTAAGIVTSSPTAVLPSARPKLDISGNWHPPYDDGPRKCSCPRQDCRFRASSREQTLHVSPESDSTRRSSSQHRIPPQSFDNCCMSRTIYEHLHQHRHNSCCLQRNQC